MLRRIVICILLLCFNCRAYGALKAAKFYSKASNAEVDVVAGELLVKFKPHVNRSGVSAFAASKKCNVLEELLVPDVYRIKVPDGKTLQEVIDEYEIDPDVEYVAPNHIRRAFITPDDTSYPIQWGLHNTGQSGGTPDVDIDAPEAWEYEVGDPEVIVAVLDSGVDLDHPDLINRLFLDGQKDFVNNDDDADDDHGHGTHVAGIIAAEGNNAEGISGVCMNSLILPIKVLDENGDGDDADIANAILYASGKDGVKVINLSLGGLGYAQVLKTAVEIAYSRGCILCAAMGNDDLNAVHYPAAFEETIAVGAINSNGVRCSPSDWGVSYGSTYGSHIDLVAPGNLIFSSTMGGSYGNMSGTSMATPFVSGVCALMLSWNSGLTNVEIIQALSQTVVDVTAGDASAGWDIYTGSGCVNAAAALESIDEGVPAQNIVKIGNNYFNPTTGGSSVIYYYLTGTASVTIKVYNLLGEEIASLVDNETKTYGKYSVEWAGLNRIGQYVASGVYFVKMNVGEDVRVSRVVVTK